MNRQEREICRAVAARFPAGATRRVALLQHGEEPAIEPDELLLRVFIEAAAGPEGYQQSLDAWEQAHQAPIRRLRRELALRLPAVRQLEFTIDAAEPDAAPRLTLPVDLALAAEPLSVRETVETALALLRAGYVFPDRAQQAGAAIEARLAAGDYDGLDEAALAERLTAAMFEICADKHLRVRLSGPVRSKPAEPRDPAGPPAARPARPKPARPGNYGIYRVERLDGNIGYLDLHAVADPEIAGPVIAAAMELVAGTYALIIDLRRNGGGSVEGVVFWCSYLFPGAGTHLNDVFDAESGQTRQFWSLAYVPGSRYLDRPVYLLTSRKTFSGGEDLCYTLQAQGRAELIGETTGGGAHPTRTIPISGTIAISVPFARSVNPVTGTNWEGTGVAPDVVVPAAEAYDVAYAKALRHVLSITVPQPITDEAHAALAGLPAVGQD